MNSVREIQENDIALIADYWLNSDPDFMVGMGVDLDKLPSREGLTNMLMNQLALPYEKKGALALIWEVDGQAVGHCNVNEIVFGEHAKMHLHLWSSSKRRQGIGTELVKQSIPLFFKLLHLKTLFCEPYALNSAPNRVLEKVGFEFVKRYVTVPGSLNFEQEVMRWKMDRG